MYKFILKLADLPVEINSRYNFSRNKVKEYVTADSNAVLSARVPDAALCEAEQENVENRSSAYVEWVCIYREIAEQIPHYDRVVMHGAVIAYKGEAFMFTAPSGTGKSTHIALWKSMFGEDVEIINGDKPILKITDSGVTAYGTPWSGKEGWHSNVAAPLKGICLLKRGKLNKIKRIDAAECLSQLLRQVYLPKNEAAAEKTLELFGKLVETVPIYVLECDISETAVMTAFGAMVGCCTEREEDAD
ncbi:MAG: hypothetical protein E7525_00555 [Ruminococcaceae bacterium]|nr:hypothetical protein [Oscillospiraceae bacterium]